MVHVFSLVGLKDIIKNLLKVIFQLRDATCIVIGVVLMHGKHLISYLPKKMSCNM